MTTFNTGNPIGSTDARDRADNSENLDLAVNSLSQTFVDRLGVTRDTLEGVYQKSAYYRAGTFDAGYTLTNNRQTLAYGNIEYSWSGAFPKVVPPGSTPATTGGVGAGAWVDRTDDTLRADINIVQKRFASVSDMIIDITDLENKTVETISYYAGWSTTKLGPVGGAKYIVMSAASYAVFRGNALGPNDASNGSGLVDHLLASGLIAVLLADENGRINVQKCGAIPDMNTSDPSGTDSAGTNVHPSFIAAISRGVGVNVPAGDYRIHGEINLTTNAGGLYGAGWFKSRLWYTQTEGSSACVKINNENNTLSNIGICNGVNVSAAESRTNLGILQESGGNLGLDSVYISGFGYGAKISNYFANRIVVEFCKQVGIWDFAGRKSNLHNVTIAACRVPLRVGDGTNNTQCQDKAYSNLTLEDTATSTAWQTAYEPLIDIVGRAAHTQWNNIRLINPYGAAVRINNTYSDGGTVYSESCHEFSNIKVRNNRNMTGYTNQPCFDITASSDVIINGLNTHQPVLSTSYGFDSAVYVRDTLSRVKINNSSIGGSLLSIGSDSIKGYTSLCGVTNTEYNAGGVTFNCGNTQEDGHTTALGNKSGTVNLTLDFGRTISMVVTGAITMSTIVNNANVGDRVRLIFIQDATGGYAISFNSAKWKASLAAASGAANTRMTVEFQYDGTYMVQIGASSPWMA